MAKNPLPSFKLRPGMTVYVAKIVTQVTLRDDGTVLVEYGEGYPPETYNETDALPEVDKSTARAEPEVTP